MDARIIGERELEELRESKSGMYNLYKRVPWVYAHGRLEDDMGTDLVYLLSTMQPRDRFKAYYKDKCVMFHMYRNRRNYEWCGLVTYADDIKAYAFAREVVDRHK